MCRPVVHRAKRERALILLHRTIPLAAGQHKCTRLKAAMRRDTIDWLICDLKEQAGLLNVSLSSWGEKPTNLEVLLLKKPSNRQYVIYRCLWDSGFNPTQKDWLYHYIFLSGYLSDKITKDLKLSIHEIFYILKNENSVYVDLIDESGNFKDDELQKLYSQASTILMNLKAVLSKMAGASHQS